MLEGGALLLKALVLAKLVMCTPWEALPFLSMCTPWEALWHLSASDVGSGILFFEFVLVPLYALSKGGRVKQNAVPLEEVIGRWLEQSLGARPACLAAFGKPPVRSLTLAINAKRGMHS